MGTTKFPALVNRCNGVLKAFQEAERRVSSNITEHIIHLEKPRNGTMPTTPRSVAMTIRKMKDVTGIVYLTGPTYNEMGASINTYLNDTRDFKFASFDFNRQMLKPLEDGSLHYSISSLLYLQTLIPVLLLYIQVRLSGKPRFCFSSFALLTWSSLQLNSSMWASESIRIISQQALSW